MTATYFVAFGTRKCLKSFSVCVRLYVSSHSPVFHHLESKSNLIKVSNLVAPKKSNHFI